MANKYMRTSSTALVLEEMQVKTSLRFRLTPVRMAIIKKKKKQRMLGMM
jgi:hypothetical protein